MEYLNYTTDRLSRVPTSIIIAMAGIESAWGTSRFATEGNALFGVRTWDEEHTTDEGQGQSRCIMGCQEVQDQVPISQRHDSNIKQASCIQGIQR